MPNYIPSGGIQNGQIIYDYHVYDIVGALNGTSGSDINMGLGKLFVSSSRNVGINTTTPLPAYQLVVNGDQLNIGKVEISGSGAELYVRNLITSSGATNFVTYNPTTGKFFTTSSNILGQYLLVGQTSSMLAPYLLVSQTSSMLAPYLLVTQTGAFATTASNIFKGNQIVSGNLTVTGSTNLTGLTPGVGGGYILTYDNSTGQIFYTQSISALTPPDLSGYLLIAQTSSMLSPYLLVNQTGAFATTASNQFNGNQTITGSLIVSGGLTTLFNTRATGSFTGSFTGNLTGTASFANTSSQALTASYVNLTGNSNINVDYVNHLPSIKINGSIGVQDNGGIISQANALNFTVFITASVAGGVATISVSSSILGGVQIQDDGSSEGSVFTLNFADNLDVSVAGNVATINGTMKVAKDGAIDPSNIVKLLNFSGSGVSSVSVAGNTASIFIPATSGVIIQDNGSNKGSNTAINFIGATVTTSSGTATITVPSPSGLPSVQNTTSTLVPTASSFLFSGSGVVTTQVNTNTASIHIPGTAGSNGNIQYNSGSSPAGATTFNFISSSNQVQLTGSLLVTGSNIITGSLNITGSNTITGSFNVYNNGDKYFTPALVHDRLTTVGATDPYMSLRLIDGIGISGSVLELQTLSKGTTVNSYFNGGVNIATYPQPGSTTSGRPIKFINSILGTPDASSFEWHYRNTVNIDGTTKKMTLDVPSGILSNSGSIVTSGSLTVASGSTNTSNDCAIYFGTSGSVGSWRIAPSGANLVIQKWNGTAYSGGTTITP